MYVDMMKIWRNETSQLFDIRTVRLKFVLLLLYLYIVGGECRTVTVQTGGNVTIPCHYESKYTQHKKYWCFHAKAAYNYCSILAYANETKGDVSVIDHPDQSLFTVTMRNLQDQNTGTYWCAVEIEGVTLDVTEQLYITIQSSPDLSVMSSSVSVDEGGNISVQCLYSTKYKNKHKQVCRYKDKRCYTVRRSDTSQYAVKISDDGRGSLTVVMSGLMKSDSGWYYCSVKHLQAPVQLTVNGSEDEFTVTNATTAVTTDSSSTRDTIDMLVVS
ncbi:polymeric immunoglobulin receptor-like [Misgurnus anguillicaudatus]|uniref:polymeric immunoglobulin receptor-like n=1 Tax=Misgurnus anguillicaudatus TaxID=75329 RepID=UPI003CCF5767